jgi:hypothetical protein
VIRFGRRDVGTQDAIERYASGAMLRQDRRQCKQETQELMDISRNAFA